MGLNIIEGADIPNRYTKPISGTDAESVINSLQYIDLFRSKQATLRSVNTVRIDMQGNFKKDGHTWSNIQAQINGVKGNSTVACVLVNQTSISTANESKETTALDTVKNYLKQSLNKGKIYTIEGDVDTL